MKTLKFDRNYNGKLDNDVFTTIRSMDKYDDLLVRDPVKVVHGDDGFKAEVIAIVPYAELEEVPIHTLFQDTGYTNFGEVEELFNSFGIDMNDPVVVLTLKRLEEDKDLLERIDNKLEGKE